MSTSAAIADSLLRRAFGRRARPSDPQRTARVRLGFSRLGAPVSQRDSAISRRTVMNNAGWGKVGIPEHRLNIAVPEDLLAQHEIDSCHDTAAWLRYVGVRYYLLIMQDDIQQRAVHLQDTVVFNKS